MVQSESIEYFQTFFKVSQAILSFLSLQDILDFLVKQTVEALELKAGSLRLVDASTNRLELVASYRLSKDYLSKGPLLTDQSIPDVMKGKVVVIKHASTDQRIQYRAEKIKEGIDTVISAPVMSREKVIGVLRLYSEGPRDFAPEEIEFISALAEMGGLAIINAKIYEDEGVRLSQLLKEVGIDVLEETEPPHHRMKPFAAEPIDPSKSLEYFRLLHMIGKALLSTLDSRQVINLIIHKIIETMNVKACSIRLVNETTRELEMIASNGLSEDYLKKGPLHIDRSIRTALEGHPVFILDAATDKRIEYPAEKIKEGIASILSLPITARDRVIGVLRLYTGEPRQYSRQEVAFLSAVAEIAGIVIMNAKLYEKTHYNLMFWQATLEYLGFTGDQKK
jgi:signal transduction protein with GAF and PtsI domain